LADIEAHFLVGEVDRDAVEQAQHVHPDQDGGRIFELEQAEGMRVREYDRHVAQAQIADPDLGHQPGFARDGFAGDADQFACGPDGRVAEQRLAQRIIADRILSTGIDDRDHLLAADLGVGDHQLTQTAACSDGDGCALGLDPPTCARQRDQAALEIEHDVAVLQHVGAEEAGRAQ